MQQHVQLDSRRETLKFSRMPLSRLARARLRPGRWPDDHLSFASHGGHQRFPREASPD
jgi:hypothetical protein